METAPKLLLEGNMDKKFFDFISFLFFNVNILLYDICLVSFYVLIYPLLPFVS